MDKRRSEEITTPSSLEPGSEVSKDKGSYTHLVNEGFLAGQRIAKISVVTLISIGIVELVMGHISGSVVATADGVDSMSDAMISFIVLIGLRFARRPADRKFQFGYHKVESFAALMAAIGMIVIGSFIVYNSYGGLIHPEEIQQPLLTMVVLAIAGGISLHRAFQMRSIANKYNLLSLKTDAKNSIKDGSASVLGFLSVLIATQFGFLQADAIGGLVIAGFIFSVAYVSLKQSSLILVDAWHNPVSSDYIKKLIEQKFEAKVRVRSIKLRQTGIISRAEIHLEIDGNKPLNEVEMYLLNTESVIKSNIPSMDVVLVVPHAKHK
ncbi:MAG: cation transporter [Thaumarchaeota archaeon]|nr:MAG: cation transporter [Nitrososphaerota archaeon]TLX88775.1 MAG: cation transporter [Nitrososphaerota archaeon]